MFCDKPVVQTSRAADLTFINIIIDFWVQMAGLAGLKCDADHNESLVKLAPRM